MKISGMLNAISSVWMPRRAKVVCRCAC